MLRQIIKIIRYIPLLWKDRDWDWTFFITFIERKLEYMEKELREGHAANAEQTAKQVKVARVLCQRILADEYCALEYRHHKERWGELYHTTTPSSTHPKLMTMHFHYKKAVTPEEYKKASKEDLHINTREEYLLTQDINYLFKHLAKYLRYWWD